MKAKTILMIPLRSLLNTVLTITPDVTSIKLLQRLYTIIEINIDSEKEEYLRFVQERFVQERFVVCYKAKY